VCVCVRVCVWKSVCVPAFRINTEKGRKLNVCTRLALKSPVDTQFKHVDESCHTHMSHVTHTWFMLRIWTSQDTHMLWPTTTISRLLEITGLFCKKALQKRPYSAKETYNFQKPTNRSHPIWPTFENVQTLACSGIICVHVISTNRFAMSRIWMRHVTHMTESTLVLWGGFG